MSRLERVLDDAVKDGAMPFAVGAVATADDVLWRGAAGDAAPGLPADQDTVMRIVSMTKAIGCTAVAMMIERGSLEMDTPVASILPEFAELRVLDSIGPDGPVLRPPRTVCTLRHLLTHTAGFSYETFDAKQAAYSQLPGAPNILAGTLESLNHPLMFDPGTAFVYGMGTDWAGRMVEAVDGRRMDRLLQEELFDPLGMTSTTFTVAPFADRLSEVAFRAEDGAFVGAEFETNPEPEVYCIGHGLYSTARDYLAFLRMILGGGVADGRRYLGADAVALMYEGQSAVRPVFGPVLPAVSAPVEMFPDDTPASWTAAFFRNDASIPQRRAAGSLCWAGFLNTQFWLDPARGLTAVLMTQLLPFCDPRFMAAYRDFERAVYAELA